VSVRPTRLGLFLVAVFVVGAVVFFVSAGKVAVVGGIVALLAVAFGMADQLPAGVGGGLTLEQGTRWRSTTPVREPEYIEHAEEPSEDAWRREEELYRRKANSEDDGLDAPRSA
jgi:hypothetical protein